MAIKSIKSNTLRGIWEQDNLMLLPGLYRYTVRDILFDLDAAKTHEDLDDIGAVSYDLSSPNKWSVTVTVNNVEPCAVVLCDFWQGDCYNVDLKEYNA